MATIFRLEDLETWKEARALASLIYFGLNKLPESEKYNLKKHLWQCGRNIPGNIAEGFGRFHFQDSMQFYRVALGSLNEIKSDTYLCLDVGYWNKEFVDKVVAQIDKVIALTKGLVASANRLKKSSMKKTLKL